MRADLTTIQQTLTPEAAAVLTHSIAEAARRHHGQTTPLHVAATLLSSPSSLLRQACLRSHPTTSHPLQCRALELCFSVALDRLPSFPTTPSNSSDPNPSQSDPPISNALIAALKRAQAHQRRGCPEQQNQPLLAVKVELDQLVVSILNDPSVSRVMKEASFSSPAVKSAIEQSLSNSPSPSAGTAGARRNLYVNPRLQQRQGSGGGSGGGGGEEVKKVLEILMRTKKRNPVLVGDSDPGAVMKEVLLKIERREFGVGEVPLALRSAKVLSFEKELGSTSTGLTEIPGKIKELGVLIETQISSGCGGGVVVDLGDLKWLVESGGGFGTSMSSGEIQQKQIVSEMGRAAVAEMGRILGRFGEGGGGGGSRIWVVGTATSATYLRCQVYHPTMESEWDLQAVLIAPRTPLHGLFPRLGSNGILSSSVEGLAPAAKGFPPIGSTAVPLRRQLENTNASQKPTLCSLCMESYERELAKLVAEEFEKSSSDPCPALPQWLQIATPGSVKPSPDQLQTKEHELKWKQGIEELLKRWRETCSRLHPTSHPAIPRQNLQPKLTISQSFTPIQMRTHLSPVLNSSERPTSSPPSPVKTDLVLGHPKSPNDSSLEKAHRERIRDFPGCNQDKFSGQQGDKFANFSYSDSLKRLFKSLTEKVGWQPEAAFAVAGVVMQCKSGNGKRRGFAPKADAWLLFIGPDKVGKRKMAHALSELVFGTGPITIRVGSPRTDGGDDVGESMNFRGKTSLDCVAEAIRQNPFSVIVLEDFDRADAVVRGTIKRAIERGRLLDSYGREVGLGSTIFVLTADWLPDELKNLQDSLRLEEKILYSANSGWQLELSVGEKTGKRRADWLLKDTRPTKPRKELSLSLDLNLAAGDGDDDPGEGSWNSSDLTVDHEHGRPAIKDPAAAAAEALSSATELINSVDEAITFKPVDFGPLRRRISESISAKFAMIMSGGRSIRIDDDALDQLVGGVWLGGSGTAAEFEEWAERVFVPAIEQLRSKSTVDDGAVFRLSSVKGGERSQRSSGAGNWLPTTITVVAVGYDGHLQFSQR